jgi:hypothetical protein
MKVDDKFFENVAKFKYLAATVTNQKIIQQEIDRRLNSGNAYYPSVQNLLSSPLQSKNVKIRIYKTIILLVVLYVCEILFLKLKEKNKLDV